MESSQSRTTTRSSQYVPVASQTSWTFGTFGNSRVGVKGAGRAPAKGVGALIQRGGRAVAGMLTIATAGGS